MRHRLSIPVTLIALTVMLGLDTLAWWQVQKRLMITATHTLNIARKQGWSVHYNKMTRAGWPFGATLTLGEPGATYTSSAPDAPKIGWAAHALTLGGFWPAWFGGGLPFHATGPQALRIVSGATVTTLTAPTLSAHLATDRALTLTGPFLHLDISDGIASKGTVDLGAPSLDFRINPQAGPDGTRLGLKLHARHLGVALASPALSTTLSNIDLAVALTGGSRNSTLWSRSGYTRLLIQNASGVYAYAGQGVALDLSAALSMPDLDGDATIRLPHWRRAATMLLALPATRQSLPPRINDALNRYVSARNTSRLPDTLTVTTTIHGGLPSIAYTSFLRHLARMFDVPPMQE